MVSELFGSPTVSGCIEAWRGLSARETTKRQDPVVV
jgi:hypothetical protein